MKSGKQRRLEIKDKRRKKAMENKSMFSHTTNNVMPKNALKSDPSQFSETNFMGIYPMFYLDMPFLCVDCGSEEIWTAKQQKWWYEIIKGSLDSTAKRCRRCRKAIRDQKAEQKAHMEEMEKVIPHPNEAFFKKKMK